MNLFESETLVSKKLTDDAASSLILACLFSDTRGEGVAVPTLVRFCSVQSAKGCSTYRVENIVTRMIQSGYVLLAETKTPGGRIYKRYSITTTGVLYLSSLVPHLPKTIRPHMQELLDGLFMLAGRLRENVLEMPK